MDSDSDAEASSFDFSVAPKPEFCTSCGRAYCFGSGPNGLACQCCRPCFRGKCKKRKAKPAEDDNRGKSKNKKTRALGGKNATKGGSPRASKSNNDNDDRVPLAQQRDIRVVGASSTQAPHSADNVMIIDDNKKCWKSDLMPRKKDYREQYVEFELYPTCGDMRCIQTVEVQELDNIRCGDYRIDFSVDGRRWTRGPPLWGMSSGGMRSNMMCSIEARFVRIVCEKKSYGLRQEQVGFAHVEFNRVKRLGGMAIF